LKPITPEFLRDVQRSGWLIDYVVDGMAVGQCPRAGCGLRVNLKPGAAVPQACPATATLADVEVSDYAALLAFLTERRDALALSMDEANECIGLADGHLNKIESLARQPYPATLFDWAKGLGYGIVLRPVGLPQKTLGVIARTRAKAAVKRRKYLQKRQDRLSVGRSG
jgi:transcriptional regulator with XRE-family HTH domain